MKCGDVYAGKLGCWKCHVESWKTIPTRAQLLEMYELAIQEKGKILDKEQKRKFKLENFEKSKSNVLKDVKQQITKLE